MKGSLNPKELLKGTGMCSIKKGIGGSFLLSRFFLLENICYCSALIFFNRLTYMQISKNGLKNLDHFPVLLPHQEFWGLVAVCCGAFLMTSCIAVIFFAQYPSVRDSFSGSSKALLTKEAFPASLSRIIYSAGSEPCPLDAVRALTTLELPCVELRNDN